MNKTSWSVFSSTSRLRYFVYEHVVLTNKTIVFCQVRITNKSSKSIKNVILKRFPNNFRYFNNLSVLPVVLRVKRFKIYKSVMRRVVQNCNWSLTYAKLITFLQETYSQIHMRKRLSDAILNHKNLLYLLINIWLLFTLNYVYNMPLRSFKKINNGWTWLKRKIFETEPYSVGRH
jgi:hypothetical protein